MSVWTALREQPLEFFLLRAAEARLRARSPDQATLIVELTTAADRRLGYLPGFALRESAIISATLLREALVLLLHARGVERDGSTNLDERRIERELELACADERAPHGWQRLSSLLAARGPLALDRMSVEALRELGTVSQETVRWLRRRTDARSVDNVRWLRRGRLAAVVLVIVLVVGTKLHDAFATRNVALGKPVKMSSLAPGSPAGSALVDGVESGRHPPPAKNADFVKTNGEASPSATIDLGRSYAIQTVRVFNRDDDLFDDGLPYRVEISTDGSAFVMLDLRSTHFGSGLLDPPWSVDGRKLSARFVRVSCVKYLALSEIEVFGK